MIRPLVYLLILISIKSFFSCGNSAHKLEQVETKDIDGNIERYTRRVIDFAKEGTFLKINPEGVKIEEANFENDTLNGMRILYDKDGDTLVVENYSQGAFNGPYRAYYENDILEIEGKYEENLMVGKWRRYYESGELMEIVTFKNNEENGPFVEFYENGNLKAEGNYLEGDNEHGELKLYNEAGEVIRIMNCEKGICRTQWKAETEEDSNS